MIGIRGGIGGGVRGGIGERPATTGIAGVTRDALNGNYYPANATEWNNLLAAAGDGAGGPGSAWLMQQAAGNAADTIGSVTLTASGTAMLYEQGVPGAARKCIRGIDGTANQKFVNSTTAPNPSLTSTMLVMFLDIPSTPAAVRDVAFFASNSDLRYNSSGKLRVVGSVNTDGAATPGASQRWVVLQNNITAGSLKVFTDQEVITGSWVLPTSLTMIALGGQSAPAGAVGYAYAAEFSGAAAERSQAQIKTLLTTLGATIPW